MEEAGTSVAGAIASEDARLASLGYKPQLNRVLGLFSNFAVAFTYLSPMVGIYSLFILGVGTAGPAVHLAAVHPVRREAVHLPPVHPRRRSGRARVHLADDHPGGRDAVRRPRLR